MKVTKSVKVKDGIREMIGHVYEEIGKNQMALLCYQEIEDPETRMQTKIDRLSSCLV